MTFSHAWAVLVMVVHFALAVAIVVDLIVTPALLEQHGTRTPAPDWVFRGFLAGALLYAIGTIVWAIVGWAP